MDVIERPSPNQNARPAAGRISYVVLHYTGMASAEAALDRLCDPKAKVSAHYTIDEDGSLYRHVPEEKRAWHAGVSAWKGATDINALSIGIELVNPGHEFGYRAFPDAQMQCLLDLLGEIYQRHGLGRTALLSHAEIAPARKEDPGELFDWPRLANAGFGIWPAPRPDLAPVGLRAAQSVLREIGFDLPATGEDDAATQAVLRAFQRRYRPARIDGALDAETAAMIAGLAAALE